ncbi:carbohydrate ABC transporter permease [Wenxinia marina]|uniref:Carbohydrate ABC transporter membrane protein 1, CUT1 family n=1 Tax=Wenxinia marina DSM 24838 TaxID=1123501 RepID=A0A0D0QAW2_9RHOB|nr:sugar ABC transporter permease [Wenxinia marina]KIQ68083.1 carbohydrate ABC transporter membrane protein 1, CUT1 family [Wenxinia marina DSM 24838]GGL78068.1 sugar ABC transporter permease [Wenxinia marina]
MTSEDTTLGTVSTPRRRWRFWRAPATGEMGVNAEDNLSGFLFMLPWLIGFVVFMAGPLLASLYLSFTRYDLFTAPEWRGTANYERLFFRDRTFADSMQVTVVYVLTSVPLRLGFALAVAMLLNRGVRGLPLYRAIYYLPSLIGGSVAIAILWRELFGYEGLINDILVPLGFERMSWIGSPDTALSTLVVLAAWQFGSPMVIFLAGLKQIPKELYEAADMDGGGPVQKFFYITLPMLTPVIFFNLLMQMISAFQAFTPAYIVSEGTGGPAGSTLFYTLYLYQQAFSFHRMGYASAMAWVLLAIVATVTMVNFVLSRRWVYYADGGRG